MIGDVMRFPSCRFSRNHLPVGVRHSQLLGVSVYLGRWASGRRAGGLVTAIAHMHAEMQAHWKISCSCYRHSKFDTFLRSQMHMYVDVGPLLTPCMCNGYRVCLYSRLSAFRCSSFRRRSRPLSQQGPPLKRAAALQQHRQLLMVRPCPGSNVYTVILRTKNRAARP